MNDTLDMENKAKYSTYDIIAQLLKEEAVVRESGHILLTKEGYQLIEHFYHTHTRPREFFILMDIFDSSAIRFVNDMRTPRIKSIIDGTWRFEA